MYSPASFTSFSPSFQSTRFRRRACTFLPTRKGSSLRSTEAEVYSWICVISKLGVCSKFFSFDVFDLNRACQTTAMSKEAISPRPWPLGTRLLCFVLAAWLMLMLFSRYFTLAHEIAHNLVHPHNSEHEFYFSAICEAHLVPLSKLLPSWYHIRWEFRLWYDWMESYLCTLQQMKDFLLGSRHELWYHRLSSDDTL